MGAKFGCLRKHSCLEQDFHQPESRIKLEPSLPLSRNNTKRKKANTEQIMTLQDHLLASPKVHPSASPERNAFFTSTSSFSKIEEVGLEASIKTLSGSSSRKKVSFKLPQEADIFFYSPGESFEE
ncbi:hypothetical protein LIER_14065 [Lithospermum erythrorhizon]|uniref:Uncharacterized protein n=1 Tax=Lithospermum erythrorhizon TaxID=34254 RepID=A0AAV3PZP7_LITER